MKQRYFLAAYQYYGETQMGFGNLYFNLNRFPSMSFLRANASIKANVKANEIVVLSIQEFSEQDYNELVK